MITHEHRRSVISRLPVRAQPFTVVNFGALLCEVNDSKDRTEHSHANAGPFRDEPFSGLTQVVYAGTY